MEPSRDNPLIRFSAFWWGISVISLFGVLVLILWLRSGGNSGIEPLEQAAAIKRYEVRASIDAAQKASLDSWKVVEEGSTVQVPPTAAFEMVGAQLIASKPSKIEDPAQVIPNTPTAEKLAGGPSADYAAVDALTPAEGTAPDAALLAKGEQGYLLCAACHGPDGKGVQAGDITVGPPLAGSEWVTGPVSNLIRIQMRGLTGPITVAGKVYNPAAPMTAMGAASSDEDVAAVLTYVRNSFGNSAPPVLPEQVKALRSEIGKPALTEADLIPVK
ncbi:c-type cytochrome [Haloferula chungangensis]|uniref:C-type cytochrome n=1 Tax=Haloferula chungangensis TaxID=1048331 RepID=A0ABW2L0J3_9BACT